MSPDGEIEFLHKDEFEDFKHMQQEEALVYIKKLKNSKSKKQTKSIKKMKKESKKRNRRK